MAKELEPTKLLGDLRALIEGARTRAAAAVNHELVLLYWRVGHRIHVDLLDEARAAYGSEIVATLSRQSALTYGRGFSRSNLHRMVQFARLFSGETKVSTRSRELSWSHFLDLLPIDEPLARDF